MVGLLKRKWLMVVVVVVVVVVVSGFTIGVFYPADRMKGYDVERPPFPTPIPTPTPGPGDEGSGSIPDSFEDAGRKIIYNAWISLEVQDVDVVVSQIQAAAEEFGGYLSQMSISKGKDVKTGSVMMRIPQADFYSVIGRIELLGEVKDKNISSEDVTERYVDLKARLENAQRQEQRLIEILDKAYDVEDILNIERELNRIREQIEIYTGQLNYLETRVEYATITIALTEPSPPAPLPEVDWDATLKRGLWGLFIIVQGLIVLAFVIIPPIVVGVPIYYIYKRRRERK